MQIYILLRGFDLQSWELKVKKMAEQPKLAKDAQRDKTEGEKKVMLARVFSFLGVQFFAKGLCQVPQFAGLLPRPPPGLSPVQLLGLLSFFCSSCCRPKGLFFLFKRMAAPLSSSSAMGNETSAPSVIPSLFYSILNILLKKKDKKTGNALNNAEKK